MQIVCLRLKLRLISRWIHAQVFVASCSSKITREVKKTMSNEHFIKQCSFYKTMLIVFEPFIKQ